MYNAMTTPKGRQYQLELADGSKVWLNAASSITYPTAFTGNERKVTISGEAYFEISPDKTKPFKVSIDGKGEVEVLGTHFNINAYADEPTVNTTLLEGSVKIRAFNSNAGPEEKQKTLYPGQQARLNVGLVVVDSVNTGEVMAWKNGYFSFNGATTEAIMRQVKRWYDAEIIYEGTVKEERFAGSVPRSANASKLLEVLELTKTVKFVIEDKKIIVKPYQ
jgi:ferric-dicitrate binding protein FerR (iron transport regulator)